MVGGIQSGRRVNERLGSFLQRFVPRLLPGAEDLITDLRITHYEALDVDPSA